MKVGTNPSDAAALAKDASLASSEPSLASPASAPPTSKQPLLKEGVKASWLAAFLFASFLTIATFVYINTSQAVLLSERFGVQKSEMNRFQGNLSAVDEAVAMVMGVVWGVLSDRVGRRLVFVSGFGLMAVALLLYPTSKDIYYGLSSVLTFRIIFALGGSAAADMLTAVVADYAREGRRSQLSGLMGFCTGLGACFGAFVLTRLPGRVGLDCAYWTAAGLLLAGAGCIAWKVRPAPLSLAEPGATATAHERCWWRRMLLGFGLLGKHPLLLVAYAGGFVARGDTVVLPVFLPGWLSYRTGRVDDRLVSSISGTCHLAALLGAPVAGLLGDRLGRTRVLLVCALTSALAYTCMPFLSSPLSLWSFLCIALQGFAQIGTIITSMSLLAAEAPADSRGAVAGVYSLCGAAGIVAVGRGGAALGGTLNGGGPFLFMAGVNAVLAVLTLTASIRGQGSRK